MPLTVNAFCTFPGLKAVVWPRPSGAGENRLAGPTGIVATAGPSFWYPNVASNVPAWFVTQRTKMPIRGGCGGGVQCCGKDEVTIAAELRPAYETTHASCVPTGMPVTLKAAVTLPGGKNGHLPTVGRRRRRAVCDSHWDVDVDGVVALEPKVASYVDPCTSTHVPKTLIGCGWGSEARSRSGRSLVPPRPS